MDEINICPNELDIELIMAQDSHDEDDVAPIEDMED